MTEEVIVDGSSTTPGAACTNCEKQAVEEAENENMSMAFLLALTPVLALTFFGQVGLL